MATNFRSVECQFWSDYSNDHHNKKIDGPAADAARAQAGFIVLGIVGGAVVIGMVAIVILKCLNRKPKDQNFERL